MPGLIRAGNSNIRNPILVSYVAKGLLPYYGLGSGIKRALEKWLAIDFTDGHDGCLFTATVHRKPVEELELEDKGALIGADKGAVRTYKSIFIRDSGAIDRFYSVKSSCFL